MNPRYRGLIRLLILAGVLLALFLIFPGMLAFVEMAAREIRYLWWVVLLFALGVWLIWGIGRKPKK